MGRRQQTAQARIADLNRTLDVCHAREDRKDAELSALRAKVAALEGRVEKLIAAGDHLATEGDTVAWDEFVDSLATPAATEEGDGERRKRFQDARPFGSHTPSTAPKEGLDK